VSVIDAVLYLVFNEGYAPPAGHRSSIQAPHARTTTVVAAMTAITCYKELTKLTTLDKL